MENTKIIILAAGKGTRMKSDLAKVLHEVKGRPMICRVLDMVKQVSPTEVYLVIGHQAEKIREITQNFNVIYAEQKEQLGTGHAVMAVEPVLKDYAGDTVILCGDVPLLKAETVQALLAKYRQGNLDGLVLTVKLDDPKHYGRIVRNFAGYVERIVEYRDADAAEKAIQEINSGIYCFNTAELFAALKQIKNQNEQKEYYLTDVIGIMVGAGKKIGTLIIDDYLQVHGVNDAEDLKKAEAAIEE
ncbi:N-acetylglucosamine-1-phosphate uridyltransferase [Candidatus Termititenax aidoneus]|uniref:N-acetylglucosamine-1-phosphate uridyltransferase n=1 Tax=Termititenax aidoneus TaxID=2218524 RepID=A0A388T8P1_TERA1|nr:N-acetylglucosamine-1-phosphate uridyltransferase [Candidatus Termititenax aidoneus]